MPKRQSNCAHPKAMLNEHMSLHDQSFDQLRICCIVDPEQQQMYLAQSAIQRPDVTSTKRAHRSPTRSYRWQGTGEKHRRYPAHGAGTLKHA